MKVFAISDLHFSTVLPKPMEIFGDNWDNHAKKICEGWNDVVAPSDLVLIPGDISWAMTLEDALPDIELFAGLNGKKLLLRGNHDYWWSSVGKLRRALPEGVYALQNDAVVIDGLCVCGSRGWVCCAENSVGEDRKIYLRELGRLELSLKQKKSGMPLVAMTHFPPFDEAQSPSGFTELYEKHGVTRAIYGHLHAKSCKYAFEGELNGVNYTLVSCDHLGFKPKLIMEI